MLGALSMFADEEEGEKKKLTPAEYRRVQG
jgi:hypothetical protein